MVSIKILCNVCKVYETSVLNYGSYTASLQNLTVLKEGYVCLVCQSKFNKLGDKYEN